MKKDIVNLKTTIPTINKTYNSFNIVGQTVGRYFDYKRETKLIEHETQKVKEQTKIIVKQIDSELKKSLDNNDKNFKKEMRRLENIAKSLNDNSYSKKQLLKEISFLTKQLIHTSDTNMQNIILDLIKEAHNSLKEENKNSLEKLNSMQNFDSDTKLIKG